MTINVGSLNLESMIFYICSLTNRWSSIFIDNNLLIECVMGFILYLIINKVKNDIMDAFTMQRIITTENPMTI